MIGNAHIDAVWLWHWQEGYQEARATFSSALDRMEEFPDYTFTADSVAYLAQVLEHDPALFARIVERIRDGRFEFVGGWWVEPDCNLPSGEAFARHALYSQRFLHEHTGKIATIGCNVDPFGHNVMLPQLLSKARMTGYAFLRPSPNEKELPAQTFWWEAPDGSRVMAYRIPHEYCSDGGQVIGHVTKALQQAPVTSEPLMVFYGVGNHGGGPTVDNITSIEKLATRDLFPEMFPSSMRRFFDEVDQATLPVVRDELQPHAVGCYAANSGFKKLMRRTEWQLLTAERWSTIASVVADRPVGNEEFAQAWKQVLFNQFHDTMAGTAIEPAYQDARDQMGEAASIGARWQNAAVQAIATHIDIPAEPDMVPVIVFNPHAWPIQTTAEFEFRLSHPLPRSIRLLDDTGTSLPLQHVRSHGRATGRRRIAFRADVPPMGYRVYRMFPLEAVDGADTTKFGSGLPMASDPAAGVEILDNGVVRAVIDSTTGRLLELSRDGRPSVLDPAAPEHLQLIDDPTDTWSHGVRSLWTTKGAFECVEVVRTSDGPVRQAVWVRWESGRSRVWEEYTLDSGSSRLDVHTRIDWQESLTALKICVGVDVNDAVATHEVPYGHLERSMNGHEVPSHAWVDISGTRAGSSRSGSSGSAGPAAGLAMLNDGKYSFAVRAGGAAENERPVLAMTAVRSPAYAWHDPHLLSDEELEHGEYDIVDAGLQRFTYSLVPHDGDWRDAGVVRAAQQLNAEPVVLVDSFHPGELGWSGSFGSITGQGVVVSVLKAHEDGDPSAPGDGVVVRAYETFGRRASVTLRLPLLDREVRLRFGPNEIKTVLVPRAGDAQQLDLIEWDPAAPVPPAPPMPSVPGVTVPVTD